MIMLILFVLSTIGLTNILVDGSLFAPIRKFASNHLPVKIYKIFECYQCMGTWCGFGCGYILLSKEPLIVVCCGFAGSFLAVIGNIFINYLEARTIVSMGDQDEHQTI